jgi:hypothetical protein
MLDEPNVMSGHARSPELSEGEASYDVLCPID